MRVVVVCLLLSSVAAAQKMSAAAQKKLDEGVALHEAGDYAGAIEAFRAGYQAHPHRDFLYAIGQSERKRGNCRGAIEAYRAFLAEKPPAKEAHKAETNIGRCEVKLAEEKPAEPPPAKKPEPTPEPRAEPPPRPQPEPAPLAETRPPERAPPRATEATPAPDDGGLDWVTTTLYASGGMAIAIGGALLIMANGSANEANSAGTLDEYAEKRSATGNLRLVGFGALVVGTALVGGGVVRMVLRNQERSVGTALVPGGAVLVLGGRF
jgi:hypothetical protein